MARYLTIGGSGHVSGPVARYAASLGHHVITITRGQRPLPEGENYTHLTADRDADDLAAVVADYDYDAVLDVIPKTPAHAAQAVALAGKCRRLVFVSTDYVYHPAHRQLRQSEDDAVYTDFDDYAGDKRRSEEVVIKAQQEGLVDLTILRPPHVHGPGSNPGTIPNHGRRPTLLADLRAGTTLRLIQYGLGLIQPIHCDDLARIIVDIAAVPQAFGQAINAVGPDLMTHADYYRVLADCAGADLKIVNFEPNEEEAKTINPYVWGHRYYDRTKIETMLPDFKYTDFVEGMAHWVKVLDQQDGPG